MTNIIERIGTTVDHITGGYLSRSRTVRQVYYSLRNATTKKHRRRQADPDIYEFDDHTLLLDTERFHQRQVAEGAISYEREAFRKVTSGATRVFDIGANIGSFTVIPATNGAEVIAVEPDPIAAAQLQANMTQNDIHKYVSHHPGVVTDITNGIATLHIADGPNQGTHALTQTAHHGAKSISVPTTTVDALSSQYGHPDVIKIDVEGAEANVLDGATETLDRGVNLFVEVHDYESKAMSNDPDNIINQLADLGKLSIVQPDRGRSVVHGPETVDAPATLILTTEDE